MPYPAAPKPGSTDSGVPAQFSSVVSDSLWPHGWQYTRLPCPSPTPGASSNSCPSRWWCHPTISSSVVPFSSCLQSFPASGSFLTGTQSESPGQLRLLQRSQATLIWTRLGEPVPGPVCSSVWDLRRASRLSPGEQEFFLFMGWFQPVLVLSYLIDDHCWTVLEVVDIYRTCCFPDLAGVWKPGWVCQKNSVLLGRKEVGADVLCMRLTHTPSVKVCWDEAINWAPDRSLPVPLDTQTWDVMFGNILKSNHLAGPLQGSWVIGGKARQAVGSQHQARV